MTISIIMATYNGEKYIKNQLDSIVPFLESGDELIISDDGSSDCTLKVVNEYKSVCNSIKITEGEHTGSSTNFVSAIPKCNGDIILFCDQDDLWMPEKLKCIKDVFLQNEKIDLIMHNAGYCNSDGIVVEGDIFSRRHPRHGFLNNLLHSTYYGCCMAAKRSFLTCFIPLPDDQTPYDQYFSLLAEKKKTALFIDRKLILHRYHGSNQSRKLSFIERVGFRLRLFKVVKKGIKNAIERS